MTMLFYELILDLLDSFEKNDRSLVLNLLCKSNIDFKRPIDKQGKPFCTVQQKVYMVAWWR